METLVAIAIIMIAIAGPLVIAAKALTVSLYSRDQMIGSYLAQESMEVIKNTVDNNVASNAASWLSTLDGCDNTSQGIYHCDASAVSTRPVATGNPVYPLYLGASGYNHDSIGSASIFSRYFYISLPSSDAPCLAVSNQECQVHVVVSWNEGTVPNEIDLSSEITDAIR